MSANITIENFPAANLRERSNLNADVAVGATGLTLKNNQGLANGDSLLVGLPGAEGSEIAAVSAVNSDQVGVTVGALKLKHLQNEPVAKLFGTQAKIYRAPNTTGVEPDDSTFTLLATITLEPDQPSTLYTDNTGGDSYWYKYTYYNPTGSLESDRTQSPAARGDGDASGNYTTLDAIRNEAGFKNAPYITDAMVDAKRQAAQAEINSALSGYYKVPFKQPVNAYVADITTRLAAGLLLLQQYGAYDNGAKDMAQKKVDAARADYKDLQAGSKTLNDTNGNPINVGNSSGAGGLGFSAWPNETTPTVQTINSDGTVEAGSGDFSFHVNDRY